MDFTEPFLNNKHLEQKLRLFLTGSIVAMGTYFVMRVSTNQ